MLSFVKSWHYLFQHWKICSLDRWLSHDHDQPSSTARLFLDTFSISVILSNCPLPDRYRLPSPSLGSIQHVLDITATQTVTTWTLFLEQRAGDPWYSTHLIPAQNYKANLKCSQQLAKGNFFQTPDWQPKQYFPSPVFAFYINPTFKGYIPNLWWSIKKIKNLFTPSCLRNQMIV